MIIGKLDDDGWKIKEVDILEREPIFCEVCEKEAEDFLKKSLKVDDDEFDFFKNEASCKEEIKRLIDFVEPREERITELEKENAELKEKVSYLEDNLRVARKDRENLQLDVAKGLKEFVKDYPATSLRYLANEKYVEQLTKAKELIEELSSSLSVVGECEEEECELLNRAEQFLKDSIE